MSEFLKRIADFSPKRLLLLAAELEERVRALERDLASRDHAPIAIVGIGCRYPGGVRDAESFWDLLAEGRDAIGEVPGSRWNVDELYDADPHARGKVATRWGGFLDAPEFFDASFFGIAPVEATGMDPQQRLLLEVSWEALEDAGIAPTSLNGSRTGVFMGLCNFDYGQLAMSLPPEEIEAYFAQGASHAVAAGRISYFLGLRGPSLAIDTACSSSLVAIHEACQSLRTRESELGLAGGVNLLFCPEVTMALSRAQMMAADGRCKAFSAAANGFVRSEGCGVVVLKRLADAERDGNRILAVIRGTAINQDGRSSGLTAPNGPSQVEVIRAALADAGIAPEAVSYVEAHGTGTSLGDTIEMQALGEALGTSRRLGRLPVGSVKSNFGHAESAAGVAGLIKLTLALNKKIIPASLHCAEPNPKIDWESSCTRVPQIAEEWVLSAGHPLRIGSVSSFGFSGTNAHLIVSEAPQCVSRIEGGLRTVVLSARSAEALKTMAAQLSDRLRSDAALRLEDVAHTLAVGRSAFPYRAAIRPASTAHLIEELTVLAGNEAGSDSQFVTGVAEARAPRVAFLFAGQGGEHAGMGLSLLKHSKVFRDAIAEVDAALAGVLSISIETIFRNEQNELAQSALVQPALFAFQYGLARVWQSWGIEPDIVVGHSMGELVAASIAGVMSVADAAVLVAARGRLTGELGDPGGMIAIAASSEDAQAIVARYRQDVSIAAINGPSSIVISGRRGAVELAAREFEHAGVRVKRLNITYGSHSPAMDRVLPAFHVEALKVTYISPSIPIIADLTGVTVEDAGVFHAQYWTSHLSRPVQFARCLEELAREQCGLCIEMGPRAVLTAFGRERGEERTRWIASANGRDDDFEALQTALAEAFAAGAELDWNAVFGAHGARKVALPTYPFERQRYWITDYSTEVLPEQLRHPRTLSAQSGTERLDVSLPVFQMQLNSPLPWHLAQHRVGGKVVLPASAYLALAWNAARAAGLFGAHPARIACFEILRPLQPEDDAVLVQTALTPIAGNKHGFRISSRRVHETAWSLHATGEIHCESIDVKLKETPKLHRESAHRMSGASYYQELDAEGIHLGPAFRAIQELWYASDTSRGRIVSEPRVHDMPKENGVVDAAPHPALLDACFQVMGAAAIVGGETQLRLMTGIEEIFVLGPLPGEFFVEAQLIAHEGNALEGSIQVRDDQGTLVLSAIGIQLRAIASRDTPAQDRHSWLYEQAWESMPLTHRSPRLSSDRHWVVIGEECGVAAEVVEQLMASGESAELLRDLAQLESIAKRHVPHDIVDLRSLGSTCEDSTSVASHSAEELCDRATRLTCQNLALWQHAAGGNGALWLFTAGVQALRSRSQLSGALQAPLWGLARCATLEHPNRLRRIVDLDPASDIHQNASIIAQELLAGDDEEQVAYDGSARLAYRLRRADKPPATPLNLRSDCSYLLTGGVGGLGLRVAAWLASQGAGKLVLTTRSLSSVASRRDAIEALRRSGADVEVVQVDVADSTSMQKLFDRFGLDLPPLRGILHMAADVSGAAVDDIMPDQVRAMYRAKIQGTLVLHELTRNLRLDFFVAFSSTAAILGSSNLGSYAGANSFVDAMAGVRKAEGLPFLSINWGTWQTMRLASNAMQQQYSAGGMMQMEDEFALAWLGDLIQGEVSQAIVANIDWKLLAPLYELKRARSWLAYMRRQVTKQEDAAVPSWIEGPGESRLSALERTVQIEAARVLGYRRGDVPGRNARLADLGLDSLMAVTLRNRLQAVIGHGLPPTFAFEYPTPTEMAIALDMLLWSSGAVEDEFAATERDEIQI
jgi:myxalamid-type polyketide synthase MxaE and MxaD